MRRRVFLGLATAATLSACAELPRSGPVEQVSQTPAAPASQGVEIAPQEPQVGGEPEVILAGFLTAMATYQPDYAVARSYLTRAAAKAWKPESGVAIYDSNNHKPVTTKDSASLSAPWVGTLDAMGRFTPRAGQYSHDFRMTKEEEGEWRIANPPSGLLVARYLFARYHAPVVVWFATSDGETCVPQTVYLPDRAVTPANTLTALLAGPSPWSRTAVETAIPMDARAITPTVSVDVNGIADVTLPAQANSLNEDARRTAAAQIVLTLTELAIVRGVRITVNGTPWSVGSSASTTMERSDVASFLPVDQRAPGDLLGVKDKAIGRVAEAGGTAFTPVPGPFGHPGWGDDPGAIDISRDLTQLAVVDRTRAALWTGATEGGKPVLRFRGRQLTKPQVAVDGTVWVVCERDGVPEVVRLAVDGGLRHIALQGLPAGAKVRSFRLSPDMTQMALVVQQGKARRLGTMRVRGVGVRAIDGWRVLAVAASTGQLVDVVDVDWVEAATMVVVAATTTDPRQSLYRVSADGAQVESLGPGSADLDVRMVAAQPRPEGTTAVFLTRDGRMFRFEDRFRWAQVAAGLTAIALPS